MITRHIQIHAAQNATFSFHGDDEVEYQVTVAVKGLIRDADIRLEEGLEVNEETKDIVIGAVIGLELERRDARWHPGRAHGDARNIEG
jgi:hypothetical protein